MAGPLDLRGRVTIVDGGATATLKRIGGAMSQVAAQSRAATTYLGNATKSVAHGGRTLAAPIGGMGGTGMVGFGAAAGSLGFLRTEMEYQQAMNRTQAVLNELDETKFQRHRDLVVDLAKRYPATSAEIAKGASELAMSGMSLEQVNAVLEATVQGSMASGESIKTVGMGVTDVVMGLGWALTNANFDKVNNIMAAGATSYAQDYTQFLAGLQKTAPLARMTGTSLEVLTGMLGMLANAGFKAEKGGTALRTMMIRMGAPTPKAMAQLAKYGIKLEQFRGQMDKSLVSGAAGMRRLQDIVTESGLQGDISLGGVDKILNDPKLLADSTKLRAALAKELGRALEGTDGYSAELIQEAVNTFVGSAFKNLDVMGFYRELGKRGALNDIEALSALFGLRFTAHGSAIMASMFTIDPNTGKSAFDAAFDTFQSRIPNAVERFSEILMKGLPGAVKRLGGAFDGLLRAMASSGAIDTIVGAFDRLRDGINWLSSVNPDLLKGLTLALVGLGVLAPVGMAISAIGGGLIMLGRGVRAVGGLLARIWALTRALTGLGQAAQTAGKIGWLFGAGAAGAAGSTLLGRRLAAGMSAAGAAAANKAVGDTMIKGMSSAATVAGGAALGRSGLWAGAKMLGRGALRFIPGVGLVLMAGGAAYGAYNAYSQGGGAGDIAKGAALGSLGLDGFSALAAEAQPGDSATAEAAGALDEARRSAAEIEQTFAAIDLSDAGRRMMESLAAGITAGGASAVAAANSVAAQVRAAGERVQLNTGPAMSPAR